MLREKDVHEFLARAGITPTDTVLVHTSMRAIGAVLGGCDGLIDAFKSYLCDGLFIVPTHTWATVGSETSVFDVRGSEPCIGALPRVAAKRADGVRSLHPTHSVVAFGGRAAEFVRGEERANTPCTEGGVWHRLYEEEAKILLIGVGLDRNTYHHAIDEIIGLEGRLAPEPKSLTVIDYEGQEHTLSLRGHNVTGSCFYENFRAPLMHFGALRTGRLGEAEALILDAVSATHIITAIWARAEYDLCSAAREIPPEYYLDIAFDDEDIHRKEFKHGGSDYIEGAIRAAIEKGERRVTISGRFEVDRAVRIPSDFELVLKDCHLRQADGCFDNIFVNEHHGTEVGKTEAGADRGIRIRGEGLAILDGGTYNGLSEKNHLTGGLAPIWKNNLILFTNVCGFEISGLQCRNQRHWAMNFVYCRNGRLHDLNFRANDTANDENGTPYHGLRQNKYSEILVKNADGIDIRQGCNNILIENISGFTEDDTVALTGLDWQLEREFAVVGLPPDISHVTVRHVKSGAFCAIVRLLCADGIPIHDIEIDQIVDTGVTSPYMDAGGYAVRIGDKHLYGRRYPTPDEMHSISVSNVRGGGWYVLDVACEVGDLRLESISRIDGTECFAKDTQR